MAEFSPIINIAIVLTAALIGGMVAHRLRQPFMSKPDLPGPIPVLGQPGIEGLGPRVLRQPDRMPKRVTVPTARAHLGTTRNRIPNLLGPFDPAPSHL